MRDIVFTVIFLLGLNTTFGQEGGVGIPQNTDGSISGFIENKGQFNDMNGDAVPFVLFKKETPGLDFYLTETGATFVFKENERHLKQAETDSEAEKHNVRWERIDLIIEGGDLSPSNILKGELINQSFNNYYNGNAPEGIKSVYSYKGLVVENVYPQIDFIVYNQSEKGFKYDFVLKPGANPDDIRLNYRSKQKMQLNTEGGLYVSTSFGALSENRPITFMNNEKIMSAFELNSFYNQQYDGFDNHVSFKIDKEDSDRIANFNELNKLIIDPEIVWATFYGGNSADWSNSIETDGMGNAFVTGRTFSTNFPIDDDDTYFDGTYAVGGDVFIIKFNTNGERIWGTYYGGDHNDFPYGMLIDESNHIFIGGYTRSSDFPLQDGGGFFHDDALNSAGFILEFDNEGNRLWSTNVGGDDADYITGISMDGEGNLFVCGSTKSSDFHVLGSGYIQAELAGWRAAFLMKFNTDQELEWSTYYGGDANDDFLDLANDSDGNLFVIGSTISSDFPVYDAGTYFQDVNENYAVSTYLKFDNDGNRLWSTLFGGTFDLSPLEDYSYSCIIDNEDNLIVLGQTESRDLPVLDAGTYFKGTLDNYTDAFMVKFSNDGEQLWGTYFGGSSFENVTIGDNLAVDDCNNMYFSFVSRSLDFETTPFWEWDYYQDTLRVGFNGVLVKFSEEGELLGSTYFGGPGDDFALDFDQNGDLWMAGTRVESCVEGWSLEEYYPNVDPGGGAYYDETFNGDNDISIQKIQIDRLVGVDPVITAHNNGAICIDSPPILLEGSPDGGEFSGDGVADNYFDPSIAGIGSHEIIYTHHDDGGCPSVATITIVVEDCFLGVDEFVSDDYTVYPNPFSDFTTLFFSTEIAENTVLRIYNALGQEVLVMGGVSGDSVRINRGGLSSGVYFLTIQSPRKNMEIYTKKIIVK